MSDTLDRDRLVNVLSEVAREMQGDPAAEVRRLDAEIGDGDLGITVQKGFKALDEYLKDAGEETVGSLLKQAGMVFSEASPSTFGSLFGTALRKAGVSLKESEEIGPRELSLMLQAAVQGIMKLGKADRGDKTLLDALIPACEAAGEAAEGGKTMIETARDAADAAAEGVKATVDMVSKTGRARSFGERTRGVKDPGAAAVHHFLEVFAAGVTNSLGP
jgi:dihydroxyacetone kinase-like protein